MKTMEDPYAYVIHPNQFLVPCIGKLVDVVQENFFILNFYNDRPLQFLILLQRLQINCCTFFCIFYLLHCSSVGSIFYLLENSCNITHNLFFFAKSRFLFLMLIKKVYNGYKTPIRFFIYNFLNGHEFQITHCVHIYKSNISICHNLA